MVRPIPCPSTPKLTGKTRCRVNWKGLLILQVEETFYTYTWNDLPPSEDKWHFKWRDAKVEDLTENLNEAN